MSLGIPLDHHAAGQPLHDMPLAHPDHIRRLDYICMIFYTDLW